MSRKSVVIGCVEGMIIPLPSAFNCALRDNSE